MFQYMLSMLCKIGEFYLSMLNYFILVVFLQTLLKNFSNTFIKTCFVNHNSQINWYLKLVLFYSFRIFGP